MDTPSVLATSNIFERNFSQAVFAMYDRRNSMLPRNFESQLFLNVNVFLWNVSDVHEIINS